MNKTVNIQTNPRSKRRPSPSELDAFVHDQPAASVPAAKEPMKRLTIDIAADLHKRIRRACLEEDVDMAVAIRQILAQHFPST